MKLNTIKMIIVPSVLINNIIQVYAKNEFRQPSSRAIWSKVDKRGDLQCSPW